VTAVRRAAPDVDVATALPVRLCLRPETAEPVRRWVEGVLGWQVVDEGEGLLQARAVLSDCASVPRVSDALPIVLVVTGEHHPSEVVAAAVARPPAATVAWPDDRDRLGDAVLAALSRPTSPQPGARMLRVGGAAGGVGTSTVALALAGLSGWYGAQTLAVVGDTAPVAEARRIAPDAVGAARLWSQATVVPGVARTRVVRVSEPAATPPVLTDPAVLAGVVDVGVGADVDVLVCRADHAGLAAAATTTAGAVVVVAGGPAPRRALDEACGARRQVHLPRSARVARAGLRGRVPAGLPGSWLRPLLPLVPRSGPDPGIRSTT
jgi:hypothetical protein